MYIFAVESGEGSRVVLHMHTQSLHAPESFRTVQFKIGERQHVHV